MQRIPDDLTTHLLDIARCPNIPLCQGHPGPAHPCARIVSVQSGIPPTARHLPEPWNGDLARAPLLFVSSNPSIDEDEAYPTASWPEEDVIDFFLHRFGGGRRPWVQDGLRPLLRDGTHRRDWVRFWAAVQRRAGEILGRQATPGKDYAMMEIVRCKSRSEEGVREALPECAGRYLERTLALSGAGVIVGLGGLAREMLTARFRPVGGGNLHGPIVIASRRRFLLFLPHPNARGKRKLTDWLTEEDITTIRDA